ncbi:MAG: saccharopine dehydrogenase C-terminal domain-containing protein [Thermodesulfobacteriota bacterium]
MNVLVLGGCGIQGKAALFDLSRNRKVSRIICADIRTDSLRTLKYVDHGKIKPVQLDLERENVMVSLMKEDIDIAIDLLPPRFGKLVAEAAIETGISLVNSNYAYDLKPLHEAAAKKGISIMPECGLDPGIDLVIYGYGLRQFDELQVLNSYCGGLPEKKACTNPLNYKISWNWDAVLKSQKRDAALISDGKVVQVPGEKQHENEFIHQIDFPELGKLEAFPNGNAVHFTDALGITGTIRETGRYSLRWPGWCDFWKPIKKLGFLGDSSVPGLPGEITPHQFLVKLLEPRLQYQDDEKDLAVMQNVFIGTKNGKTKKVTFNILIERDLGTGLMAMSLGVSYPACIAAEMIAGGEITKRGLLSPVTDIPGDAFLDRLKHRGIKIEEIVEP